jgi:hypothetical protein
METKELKCTDLRIGNLIDYFGYIVKVDTLEFFDGKERVGGINTTEGDRVFDKPSYFEPIELTEEVLLKIGFEKVHKKKIVGLNVNEFILNNDINDSKFGNISYHLFGSGNSLIFIEHGDYYEGKDNDCIYKLDVKYLHQLQNAYFILTGQELNIKL